METIKALVEAYPTFSATLLLVVLAFVIQLVARPIVNRYPALSPLFRALLEGLPNWIASLLTLITGKPIQAPVVDPMHPEAYAQEMYRIYVAASRGLNHKGTPLPSWDDLEPEIQERWLALARKALGKLQTPKLGLGDKATLMMLVLGALVWAGCGPIPQDLQDKASKAITLGRKSAEFVSKSDAQLRNLYQFTQELCLQREKDEDRRTCVGKVREMFAPIRAGLGEVRAGWCELEPEKCQVAAAPQVPK